MGTKTVLGTISRRFAGGVDNPESLDTLTADLEFWIRRGTRMGARVLTFTEVCPQLNGDLYAQIEPHDGGSLLRVIDLAKRYEVDLVWPRFEHGPDGLRNASIYVDRHGEVLGRYYKMFPTLGEMEKGIIPGDGPVCIETEYGRVGFAICFDLNFIELRDGYRALRPDVVFFSSMYRGGIELQAWAVDLGCYMVSSYGTELGRIVDRGGRILEMCHYEALVTAAVNLNSIALHMDYNYGKMDAMLERYGTALKFDYYTQEARYVISSESIPIEEIVAEWELLEIQEYFRRVRAQRSELLGPPAAEAMHANQTL
ncbi:MAG: carbon-nitrogen hydrolase family protein [Armatimonadetes bacterium]|nr:carbon-nitrogen hydrolase family protein [Armatimonadota bacterium]